MKSETSKLDTRGFSGVELHRLQPEEKMATIYPAVDLSYYQYQSPQYIYDILEGSLQRVLDIGCGTGKLGRLLKENGTKEVIGIEINPEAAHEARSYLDQVYVGDVEDLNFVCESEYFDAIIYSGVLEHLLDPYAELTRRRKYLKRGGIVAVLLPNVQHFSVVLELLGGRWTLETAGQKDATHYRWFTHYEIQKMFKATGFHIEKSVGYVFGDYPPVYQQLIDRIKPFGILNSDFEKTTKTYIYVLRTRKIDDWTPAGFKSNDSFTGERAMPLATNMPENIMREHWARYRYVAPMVAGKRILDVACGAGYGSDLLAEAAQFVAGGDISAETVAYCQAHYRRDNQKFEVMDIRDIPYPDKSFDMVVSFETIEHVVEGEQFLQEITRLLADDGMLVMSTPLGGPVGNPHHVAYYQRGTFAAYLRNFFGEVQLLFQRDNQFYEHSLSPDYAPTFTGEYVLAVCQKPVKRVAGLTSIIILTHNQLEHTQLCLQSIAEYTPEPHELIIVDNGSNSPTVDYLKQYSQSRENAQLIFNADNKGFAAGNNQGLAAAKGEFVLLLNNDTVVTKGWLKRMLALFERYPQIGLVGPMSNYVAGPQLVKDAPYRNMKQMHQFAKKWANQHKGQSVEFFRMVGFCLLARRAVVDRIGGLDERFGRGNFEDDDFCIRAALAGFKARIAQDVFVHHTGNQTFKALNIDYRQSLEENWQSFKAKWNIPPATPYGAAYSVSLAIKDPSRYYIPLPFPTETGASGLDQPAANQPSLDSLLFAIKTAQTGDDWPGAVDLITQAIESNPADEHKAELYNSLGYCHFRQAQPEPAEAAFVKGLEFAPDHLDLLSNLADLYLQQGRYDVGTAYLNRALSINPDDVHILLSLGNCSLQLGQLEAALMAFKRIQLLAPDTEGIAQIITQLETV